MSVLIDSLLHLSRISRADIRKTNVNLSEMASSILRDLTASGPLEDRQMSVNVEPSIIVQGDPNLLGIVMQNLLSNAWKFTSKQEHGEIAVGRADGQNGEISVYIRDNGAGFNMEYANKLFTAFQRLHSKDEYPGTGIGLTTVKRIISKHGGRVWAEGKEGEGATFWFSLPS